jgi:hypothetical protein
MHLLRQFLIKNAEMMVQQILKKNIEKLAPELHVGDDVRILSNALTQIKKYG